MQLEEIIIGTASDNLVTGPMFTILESVGALTILWTSFKMPSEETFLDVTLEAQR